MNFQIGFWHPFGEHAGETAKEIIDRKVKEIKINGWTFWSFSYKKRESLNAWFREIEKVKPDKVLVFCSDGRGTKNPKSETKRCNYYIEVNEEKSKNIPELISIPHPMGKKIKVSAFIINKIIYPVEYRGYNLDWFYLSKGKWQESRSSTFGEHLIRPGRGKSIGKFSVILELKYPYLSEVGIKD